MLDIVNSPPKPSREDLPKDANLCEYCTAKCCQYIALPIDTPKTWKDYDDLRWYLAHGDVSIFVDEGSWYIMMHKKCNHLLPDNRCGIYDDRPEICRGYNTDNCEYDDEYTYEKIFETDWQMWEYAEAVLGPDRMPRRSTAGAIRLA